MISFACMSSEICCSNHSTNFSKKKKAQGQNSFLRILWQDKVLPSQCMCWFPSWQDACSAMLKKPGRCQSNPNTYRGNIPKLWASVPPWAHRDNMLQWLASASGPPGMRLKNISQRAQKGPRGITPRKRSKAGAFPSSAWRRRARSVRSGSLLRWLSRDSMPSFTAALTRAYAAAAASALLTSAPSSAAASTGGMNLHDSTPWA